MSIGQRQRNALQTIGNRAKLGHAETSRRLPKRALRVVQKGVHKAPILEAVLFPRVLVGRMGRKAPKARCEPGFTLSEIETLKLPAFCFSGRLECAYCGDPTQHRDHVIAVSYQRTHRKQVMQSNGPWVWACRDCNVHLSNKYFDSFKARCEWASWRIAAKASPAVWHHWEIRKLDYPLQTHIRHETKRRLWLRARADWYGSRNFYLNLEPLLWECAQLGNTLGGKFLLSYFSSIRYDISEIYKPQR